MSEPTIDFEAMLQDPEVAAKLPKDLREWSERNARKAKEEAERAEKLEKQLKAREVTDFLKSKGLSEDLADLVGDKDPTEWYNQYGSHFQAAAGQAQGEPTGDEPAGDPAAGGAAAQGGPSTPPASPGAALTPEQLQALAGIVGQVPAGSPGSAPVDDQITEATKGATSVDEFYELLTTVPGAVQGY